MSRLLSDLPKKLEYFKARGSTPIWTIPNWTTPNWTTPNWTTPIWTGGSIGLPPFGLHHVVNRCMFHQKTFLGPKF